MLMDDIATWGRVTFRSPATAEAIGSAESALGAPLPEELRELLRETDGIDGEHGLGLLWPAARIGEDNARLRSDPIFGEHYLPFDGLVFFSDAGNGDQFAISMRGPQDVYVWNHEDDSRTWVASTVTEFVRLWLAGELSV